MKTIIMICTLAFVGGCIPPPTPNESYSRISYYRDARVDLCFARTTHGIGGKVDCAVLREANINVKDW